MIPDLVTRLRFTLLSFAAAMLALYLAMGIDLQQPYWAMMTVYIVSSPLTAAVRSKAMYRLLGSLLGASVALLLVPLLDNTPVLLCLAVALWVGGCLAVSLLDRSPRSYVMLLAGYTAAIIGFSSVERPEAVFDIALARGEEILLGTLCATLLHSLWFPQAVADPLRARIRACLGHARRWADDLLAGGDTATFERDRQQLAAAANDIHQLATHLPYDTSHLRETRAEVQAVHDRILLLIPVLASLSDRLAALRGDGSIDAAGLADASTRVAAWLAAPAPASAPDTTALLAELDARIAAAPHADWAELARLGALVRLQDLVRLLSEAHELLAHLDDRSTALGAAVQAAVQQADARPLHSDVGLALQSGLAAVVAIVIACAAWIGMGWAEGGAAATVAAILCCLFAAADDPAPGIRVFGGSLLIALPLAGLYRFGVLPAIDRFPMLVLALAPAMLVLGMVMTVPARGLQAIVTLLNFCNAMALQERQSYDLAQFININLSQFFGVLVAVFVTRALRSMTAEAGARRVLTRTWRELAALARGSVAVEPAAFASRMVDRLSLLAAGVSTGRRPLDTGDALRELRTGMDLVHLQQARGTLDAAAAAGLAPLLDAVARHYAARSGGHSDASTALQPAFEHALPILAAQPARDGGRSLAALVGLRAGLLPAAAPAVAAPASGAAA